MSHRLSQNARHTNDLLEELERDKELEILREYLTKFNLFPRTRDPASAPIRFEELKELVKHWKLHRQRNFWKSHTTKEDLVRTLYRHINTKIIPQETRDEVAPTSVQGGAGATSPVSNGVSSPPGIVSIDIMTGSNSGPIAPPAKNSNSMDSPRSRSILAVNRLAQSLYKGGPKNDQVFDAYCGDLFSQRGDYEDGMIYLSRFSKPGSVNISKTVDSDNETNQDLAQEQDEEVHEKMIDTMDLGNTLSREVRLKQECAFSLYHVSTHTKITE